MVCRSRIEFNTIENLQIIADTFGFDIFYQIQDPDYSDADIWLLRFCWSQMPITGQTK